MGTNRPHKTFFTSDTHFGHGNIITYCNRPYPNTVMMDEALIWNWNQVVRPEDEVWHLGDFAFGRKSDAEYIERVLERLNGIIHIVWGNHDEEAKKVSEMFASTQDLAEIEVQKQKIVLCHYAMRSWHHNMRGSWMLYGHTHNTLPPYGKSCDVGVDAWNFTPVSFEQLKTFMNKQPQKVQEFGFKCNKCTKFPCECNV